MIRLGKPICGALAVALILAPMPGHAAESFYYRNVTPGSAAPTATNPNPSPNGETPPTGPTTLSASGVPSGPTTVGDRVDVSFVPSGFSNAVTFAQDGPDVPGLAFSNQTGVLSGTISDKGRWSFTAVASEGARSARTTVEFDTRYYPPELTLPAPAGLAFAGIPFSLQAQATNGATVVSWAVPQGSGSTVDANGLVTVDLPLDTTQASLSVTGTDAWGQSGTTTRDVTLATPTVDATLPATMRGGTPYNFALSSNLPSPQWTVTGVVGGTASVSGNTLKSTPSPSAGAPYTLTLTARSGKASVSATLSSQPLPAFALASQPTDQLILRGSGNREYPAPRTSNAIGSPAYALTKAGADVSDSLPTLCPGFAFSRTDGKISGAAGQSDCYQTLAYRITDPGDGTAPPTSVDSSGFLLQVRSNTTFAQHPGNLAVQQGSSASTTAALTQDGGYVSPLQFWRVTNGSNSGDAKPAWITLACPVTSGTCTATASPTAAIAPGTYGPYALMAGDGSGFYKASTNFTVTVSAPPASLTLNPPAAIQQTSASGSACTSVAIRNTSSNAANGLSISLSSAVDFQACTFGSAPCGTSLAAGAICNYGVMLRSATDGQKSVIVTATGTNVPTDNAAPVTVTGTTALPPPKADTSKLQSVRYGSGSAISGNKTNSGSYFSYQFSSGSYTLAQNDTTNIFYANFSSPVTLQYMAVYGAWQGTAGQFITEFMSSGGTWVQAASNNGGNVTTVFNTGVSQQWRVRAISSTAVNISGVLFQP